jgi:hypothetical protein
MKLVRHEGPVRAPALFASSAPRPWRVASRRARIAAPESDAPARRRPIGLGARTVLVTDPASVARPRLHPLTQAKKPMKRTTLFVTLLLAMTASLAAMGISAAVDTPRTLMSRDDYRDALHGIEAATRAALGQCRALELVARDVCKAQARADERVRKAELQARYYGTVAAAQDVEVARVKARYDVARAECGARPADTRLQCLRDAREARAREIHARVASST